MQDPYIVIYYGGEKKVSAVKMGLNKNPRWNEKFIFNRTADSTVRIQMWDKDLLSPDDLIGQGEANISKVFTTAPGIPITMLIELTFKGYNVGKANIEVSNGGGEGIAK